jgi:hypothetical protein
MARVVPNRGMAPKQRSFNPLNKTGIPSRSTNSYATTIYRIAASCCHSLQGSRQCVLTQYPSLDDIWRLQPVPETERCVSSRKGGNQIRTVATHEATTPAMAHATKAVISRPKLLVQGHSSFRHVTKQSHNS